MGFQFAETMTGTYAPADRPAEHRFFSFDIHVVAPSMLRHLRDGRAEMTGTVEAEGLAQRAPLRGTLTMRPRFIRYRFDFPGDDGRTYRFEGQKDLRWRDPLQSFTELPGTIRDESGEVVGTCRVHFDLRSDWAQFASSWKWA